MKKDYICSVIKHIENVLMEEINPELISQQNYISLSQLYRDFYTYTGHSVKEYIRKRRISNACEKIKCSNIPLEVIAQQSACGTQQSFNKQFKSIIGMTPLEYKHNNTYFYFYPNYSDTAAYCVKVGSETIPGCTTLRYYDTCLDGIEDRAIASLGPIKGRFFGRNGKQIANRFCYELFIENGGLGKSAIYATCLVNYNQRDINNGWNYLYNEWMPAGMFEQSEEGYFEEYIFKDGKAQKLKLYIPVMKRKTARHINITNIDGMDFVVAKQTGVNAEHRASERVTSFLNKHYPLVLRNARYFYVCEHEGSFECGVECPDDLVLPDESGLDYIRVPAGLYAVLSAGCVGEADVEKGRMERWLSDNSVAHEDRPIFAVYEIKKGNYSEDIIMHLYKKLRDDKNG